MRGGGDGDGLTGVQPQRPVRLRRVTLHKPAIIHIHSHYSIVGVEVFESVFLSVNSDGGGLPVCV